MKTRKMMALAVFTMIALAASGAFATELTVETKEGASDGTTFPVTITVDDPSSIAGAAFTVEYDNGLDITQVDSKFFDTFVNQKAEAVADGLTWSGDTSVEVDGVTFEQPLVKGTVETSGDKKTIKIAAARFKEGGDDATTTLFTLTVKVVDPDVVAGTSTYNIDIIPTTLENEAAGYLTPTEIDLLIGADASITDPKDPNAFPVRLSAGNADASVTAGVITAEEGGPVFDPGDGNNDGMIDVMDLLGAIDFMVPTADTESDVFKAYDLADPKGEIDVMDLLAIIDLIP